MTKTTNATHTPTLRVERHSDTECNIIIEGKVVEGVAARVGFDLTREAADHYAALFAAAPDLLAACELVARSAILVVSGGGTAVRIPRETLEAIEAAIAKAKGGEA